MPAVKKPAVPFKNWFDAALYRQIADELGAVEPKFDRKKFLALTLEGLAGCALVIGLLVLFLRKKLQGRKQLLDSCSFSFC